MAQSFPIHSWKRMGPWVVSAEKSGARSPMRNVMSVAPLDACVGGDAAGGALARRPPLVRRYGLTVTFTVAPGTTTTGAAVVAETVVVPLASGSKATPPAATVLGER